MANDGHRFPPGVCRAQENSEKTPTLRGALPTIKLPVTLSEHGEPHVYVGRVFTYEGRSWTVTSGYGWPRAAARFWIAENPDGSGERREVTADELEAMLGG